MSLDPDAERRILAQIQAIKLEIADGRGDTRSVQTKLDDLAAAVHTSYANGPGIGPRVIAMTDQPPRRTGPGIDLPSAAELGEYGDALKRWSLRALVLVFGLVLAWKLATGDLIASIERLWWVFNPPETVEEVQDGILPADGVDPATLSPDLARELRGEAEAE